MWINLSSGGLMNDAQLLEAGLDYLKKYRDGKGRWTGFPYYYTLYVLNEIDPSLSSHELLYAAPLIEKMMKKKDIHETKYAMRRNFIREQILEKVNTSSSASHLNSGKYQLLQN